MRGSVKASEYEGREKDHELFVKAVGNPEDSLPLFHLYRVQTEARASLVQTNAVGKTNSSGNQEECRLRVRSALEEKRLQDTLDTPDTPVLSAEYLPCPATLVH